MTFVPQHAKTNDPDVIAAIVANRDGLAAFRDQAKEFCERFGAANYYPGGFFGLHCIRAIGGSKPTEGRWSQGYQGQGWRPRKGTDLYKEFDAIEFREAQVPGLPDMVYGAYNGDGSQVVMKPLVFIHDGYAWSGLSGTPNLEDQKQDRHGSFGDQWTEVLGSEYLRAKEQYVADFEASA